MKNSYTSSTELSLSEKFYGAVKGLKNLWHHYSGYNYMKANGVGDYGYDNTGIEFTRVLTHAATGVVGSFGLIAAATGAGVAGLAFTAGTLGVGAIPLWATAAYMVGQKKSQDRAWEERRAETDRRYAASVPRSPSR